MFHLFFVTHQPLQKNKRNSKGSNFVETTHHQETRECDRMYTKNQNESNYDVSNDDKAKWFDEESTLVETVNKLFKETLKVSKLQVVNSRISTDYGVVTFKV